MTTMQLTLLISASAHAQEKPIPLDTLRVQVGSRVSANLPVLTRSVQLIDRSDIEALPVRTISGLLDWAVGVEVSSRSPAQADLSLRGAGFEQVVVLVNGIRMSDPQTGHFDLDLAVPLERIERVEVLRGPASALYGADAVGGVVNIVTRGVDEELHAQVETGSWSTNRVSVGGGWEGDGGVRVTGGAETSRSDGHRSGTDYEMSLLRLAMKRPLGQGRLGADLALARRDFGAQDFYAPYPSFEKTRTYTASLSLTALPVGSVRLDGTTSFRRHEDDFVLTREDPAFYRNQHTSTQVGFDLLARGDLPSGLGLAIGAETFRDLLDSSNLGHRGETRGAVFGELVAGRGGAAAGSIGLRQDWHEEFGWFLSPSLSGSYRFGPSLRFRSSAGRSFRAPTWTERYYRDPVNVGSPDLDPERAWSGEVGLDFIPGSRGRLSLSAYLRKATDLVDWARQEGSGEDVPWETRNVEEAWFHGVEADMSIPGPFGTVLTLGGTALSVDATESEGYRSKYALRPIRERLVARIRRDFGRAITVSINGQRGRRAGESAFSRIDAHGAFSWGAARVHLDLTNIFDSTYPDVTGAPAPGRALSLGLRWTKTRRTPLPGG